LGGSAVVDDTYAKGCGWKESYRLKIPQDWKSGVYVISVTAELPENGKATGEHFIVVKNAKPGSSGEIALMLAISSYFAFNDRGGEHYYKRFGINTGKFDEYAEVQNEILISKWDGEGSSESMPSIRASTTLLTFTNQKDDASASAIGTTLVLRIYEYPHITRNTS